MNPLAPETLAPILDARPLLIAVAGPNGAGKSTFYKTHLQESGLPFVNADEFAMNFQLDPYAAAEFAEQVRREMVRQRKSFVFATVFSDPDGSKLDFLKGATESGYTVVLFFVGIDSREKSENRVGLRVMQGGHDVPSDKLYQRFPRTMRNLKSAIALLPHVFVLDNSDLRAPHLLVARFVHGKAIFPEDPLPPWFQAVLEGD